MNKNLEIKYNFDNNILIANLSMERGKYKKLEAVLRLASFCKGLFQLATVIDL